MFIISRRKRKFQSIFSGTHNEITLICYLQTELEGSVRGFSICRGEQTAAMKNCSQTLNRMQCRGLNYFQSLIFSENFSGKEIEKRSDSGCLYFRGKRRTLGSQKRNLIQRQTEKE